ncbi:hypothetical protein JXQ70_18945 [bacterium]|nr:hypothetical protein [bacterium]
MKMRKNGILKIRPGHLANFSGGAGYMPFVIIFSVPASLLFAIIGSLCLYARGRYFLSSSASPKTGLHEFVRYAHWHSLICILIAIIVGIILFCFGLTMLYGNKLKYALVTAVFTMGPLAAWVLSSLVLVRLIEHRGSTWTNLFISAVLYIILLAACIPLLMLVSTITGAPV